MNRFRELRLAHNLSQKDLANELCINQTAVSQWERGITAPSSNLLADLCKILDTTSDYLLGISDEQNQCFAWQDADIMSAVKNGLSGQLNKILLATQKCNDAEQKMVFNIVVELRHILASTSMNEKQRAASLMLLQSMFAISTRFVDVCSQSDETTDTENGRIAKMKQSCTEQYVASLTEAEKSIL